MESTEEIVLFTEESDLTPRSGRDDRSSETLDLLLYMTAADLIDKFDCDIVIVMLTEGKDLVVETILGIEDEAQVPNSIAIGTSFSGSLAGRTEAVIIEDFEEYSRSIPDNIEKFYSGTVASSPLMIGNDLIGLVNICRHDRTNKFSKEEIERLFIIAGSAALTINSQMMVDFQTNQLKSAHADMVAMTDKLKTELEARKKAEKEIHEQNRKLTDANSKLARITSDLAESEEKFRNLVEKSNGGIVIIVDGMIHYANPYFIERLFTEESEATGRSILSLCTPEESLRLKKYLDRREPSCGDENALETVMVDQHGNRIYMELTCGNTTFQGKDAVLLFIRDVTSQKKLLLELQHKEKLESIGRLAAGIAHEINTPTQYVGDNTRFISDSFKDIDSLLDEFGAMLDGVEKGLPAGDFIDRVKETIERIDLQYLKEEIPTAISQTIEGIERISKIVRSMKEFSHPGSRDISQVDLNKAIETTVTIARNEWKYIADMELDLDKDLSPVRCVPDQINQVILNIIINASHAIADVIEKDPGQKGKITITTSETEKNVEIRISDTGCGIPEEIRERVFDPFFTTKETGKGTGQGLAIASKIIVKDHGGKITIESEVGKGTTMCVLLPKSADTIKEDSIDEEKDSVCR
ncbi:MAG: PAS domain S-box protein [Candidatus Krumholzibacteriota bacterium]|nr:PAS domain S-box protein [Candidatus Krumholzibacteriota bacterium]